MEDDKLWLKDREERRREVHDMKEQVMATDGKWWCFVKS